MTQEEQSTAWGCPRLNYGDFISHADLRCITLGLERPFPEKYPSIPEYDAARDEYGGGRCCVTSTSCGSCC